MAIEFVDLPMNSMVILHSYVSLSEGMGPEFQTIDGYCWNIMEHSIVLNASEGISWEMCGYMQGRLFDDV